MDDFVRNSSLNGVALQVAKKIPRVVAATSVSEKNTKLPWTKTTKGNKKSRSKIGRKIRITVIDL